MAELTPEALAARVAELEKQLVAPTVKDWRKAIELPFNSEFIEQVDEEGRKYRESLRREAEAEADAEDARREGERT